VDQTQAIDALKSNGGSILASDLPFLSPYAINKLKRFGHLFVYADWGLIQLLELSLCKSLGRWRATPWQLPVAQINVVATPRYRSNFPDTR
jgi:hypothetical protein